MYICPVFIDTAVKAGARIQVIDRGDEFMNRIAVDSIEKAGIFIDLVTISKSKELFPLIPRTKALHLVMITFEFFN